MSTNEETFDEGRCGLALEYQDEATMTGPLRVDYKSERWILQVELCGINFKLYNYYKVTFLTTAR